MPVGTLVETVPAPAAMGGGELVLHRFTGDSPDAIRTALRMQVRPCARRGGGSTIRRGSGPPS